METNSPEFSPAQLTDHLTILMDQSNAYTVLDKYSMMERLSSSTIKPFECFSESCLRNYGKLVGTDWTVSGRVSKLSDKIYISIRMVSSNPDTATRSTKMEFLYIPEQIAAMLKVTVQTMFNEIPEPLLLQSLTDKTMLANARNNPTVASLNLSGPRMGYSFFTGEAATVLKKPKHEGGYNSGAAMFLFGYQMEQQYLNGDNIQGLFEFIPQVAGLDQGLFLPSVTFLNGLRSSKSGIEFAVGPTIYVHRTERKYFEDGAWHRSQDRQNINRLPYVDKMDSRGFVRLKSNLVFAAGKSFRSGKLNIPVNVYFIPNKDQPRFGFSFGYNVQK